LIFRKNKKRVREADRSKLLISFPPNSRYAESFRTLRTNLFFSDMENEVRSILVTSALEKEGKTNTAVNLGHSIAQTDRRVLLMDCDLRRPYLSSLVTDSPSQGRGVTELVTEVFGIHLTKGSLENYSVADLILLTRLQKRSAKLDLENDGTRAAIFFENGKMVDVYWKNRPDSKKLASTLVRENLLTEKQAGLALTHQKKSVHQLGYILQTMGLVSKKDLSRALSVHTIEAIRAVCAMESGHFTFSPPARDPGKSATLGDMDLEKLFMEFNTGENQHKYCHAAIENAILPSGEDNLYVLPSGQIPSNPAELVGSRRMAFLIDYLKNRFDFIIIDTPPVTPASDALIMAPMVDGTLFVVKSGHTDRKIIQDAVDQFMAVKQPIIGIVLNQVDMKKEGYYRYYHKYYSTYYGRQEGR
jgi:capsular exopolysaccharide synthesis family protein